MKHVQPPLPFEMNALEPFMSKETLEYHYGKHHKGYVDKLNELLEKNENAAMRELSLEELIVKASGPVFNNAAQAWNHAFFWQCLSPGGAELSGKLLDAIAKDFGSREKFISELKSRALEVFGSGWIWLVRDGGLNKLTIETTSNADNPLRHGNQPLLTCDLWEHAYYIDYRNERAKFVDAFEKLIDWRFAEANLEARREIAA